MPVPPEQEMRRPFLEAVKDEGLHNYSVNDFLRIIAEHFGRELSEMSSIDKNAFKAGINDAKSYLSMHELISNPLKQTYMITKKGKEILEKTEGIIDDDSLKILSSSDSGLELMPDLFSAEEPEVTDLKPNEPENSLEHEDAAELRNDLSVQEDIKELQDDIDMTVSEDEQNFSDVQEEQNSEPLDAESVADDLSASEDLQVQEDMQELPDDIDMTTSDEDTQEEQNLQPLDAESVPDNLSAPEDLQVQEESQELPDDIDMTGSDEDTQEEQASVPLDAKSELDNLSASEDLQVQEDIQELPDDIDMTVSEDEQDFSDVQEEQTSVSPNAESVPDNLSASEDLQVREDTQELPDDIDMTTSEDEQNFSDVQEEQASVSPNAESVADDLSAPEDLQVQEDTQELPDNPDNIDMTTSDEDAQEEQASVSLDAESVPDNLSVHEDLPIQEDIQELPDDIDMTTSEDEQDFSDVQEEQASVPLDAESELDNLSASEDLQVQEDTQELPDNPDNIDMTGSDEDTQEEQNLQPLDAESVPDNLSAPEDLQVQEDTQELPDSIDITSSEQETLGLYSQEKENQYPEDFTVTNNTDGDENMPENITDEDFSPAENNDELNELDELSEDLPHGAVFQAQTIDDVLERYNSELADRVLMRVASLSSETFEALVIDLLSKMGYRAFQNARYTNDESDNGMIQGVILNSNGTVPIYIHAKKLSMGRTVGRADVQDFVDALADKGGKGIFATAATFSENAALYAQDERIMLIDGPKLASLMISHNFCVNVEKVFEVKEIDEDSFNEYEH